MGEGATMNASIGFALTIALISISAGQLLADSDLVCEGKLEKHYLPEKVYFTPIGFKSLEVVPLGDCGPITNCSYNIFIKSGSSPYKEADSVSIANLCDSVEISKTKNDLPIVSEQASDDNEGGASICYFPRLIELSDYDEENIFSTEIYYTDGEIKKVISARSFEYSHADAGSAIGIWEGDGSAGKIWDSFASYEQVLTGTE